MTTNCGGNLLEYYSKRWIDRATRELGYIFCSNTYAAELEGRKKLLDVKREQVKHDIEEAAEKDKTRVEEVVQQWMEEAYAVLSNGDTETRKTCLWGLFKYQDGKELEQKIRQIEALLSRSDFPMVARPSKPAGIKYFAQPIFIDFQSRKSKFKELVEALKSGKNMIGLQGLMGMGKTTLAIQVGLHVEQSKSFKEVIFVTVSKAPDLNQILRNIASQLNFPLEGAEEQHPKAVWSRINNSIGRILVILDDICQKLELRDIGIPHNSENCCVLITTSNSKVCEAMGCQSKISLQALEGRDGLDIFMKNVCTTSEDSTSQYMDLAQEVVGACGGIPLAIVAIATTLKGFDRGNWKNVLKPLLNFKPLHHGDDELWIKVFSSLKLSYDKLPSEAKQLLLLCSLFPKGYEIRLELLSKLGMGLSLFDETKSYSELGNNLKIIANSHLIKSFLLLETKEVHVKMSDLVREVILSVEDKDTQVITNSSGELKSNLKFLSWSSNISFPNHFDATKLEVLLLWIKGGVKVEDFCAIFEKMDQLRVLFLCCDKDVIHPTLLLQPLLSLKKLQTLILNGWKLEHFSGLKCLDNLKVLVFENCRLMKPPKEIVYVEKLRLLGIRRCHLERTKTFEVIFRCSGLEELDVLRINDDMNSKPKDEEENKDEFTHGKSHPALQHYSIACSGLQHFSGDENGSYKCFNTKHMKKSIPEEMFKDHVRRAEILEFSGVIEEGWKSLVPDVGFMKDLIKLALHECPHIECLLDNREPLVDVHVFSSLLQLHLVYADVKYLCRGRMPSSFLRSLEVFKLLHCKNLSNDFFLGNYLKLDLLKVLELDDCPMFKTSIFGPSVAGSLVRLEELFIKNCNQVETLVEYQSPRQDQVVGADHQNSDVLFPGLKSLKIQRCDRLTLVLSFLWEGDLCLLKDLSIRSCEKLEYIFGEYRDEGRVLQNNRMLPSLTSMEIEAVPSFIHICKAYTKCMQRPSPTPQDASTGDHGHDVCCLLTSLSGFGASMERNEPSHLVDQRPLRQSRSLRSTSEMPVIEWPSLEHINLGGELVKRPFPYSMVCLQGRHLMAETGDQESAKRPGGGLMDCFRGKPPKSKTGVDFMKLLEYMQTWISLGIRHSEIEDVFNVEGIESEGELEFQLQVMKIESLPKLRCVYNDPNNILKFRKLEVLVFSRCDKLRAIFSSSTMKSLPELSCLEVTECRELVYIIEEDGGSCHVSLPKLQTIRVSRCDALKSLFFVSTLRKLQELESLEIEEAPNLKEVFGCEQDQRGLQEVVPNLSHLKLKKVLNLERFCRGIDLQSVKQFNLNFEVANCAILEKPEELKRPQSADFGTGQAMPHISDVGASSQVHSHLCIQTRMREAKGKQKIVAQGLTSALPNTAEDFDPFSKTLPMVPPSSVLALTRGLTKPEKAPEANVPYFIPSYPVGVASSSQTLGIQDILDVMELEDGEPTLLAKAFDLYPQLRLSRLLPRRVLAFSYRVLIDILFMLDTKTPCTITASDKLILRRKLDQAKLFGFDEDWIESVRAKLLGNDMLNPLVTEEGILVNKTKLETDSTDLEQVLNRRNEAIERLAAAQRYFNSIQREYEGIQSQQLSRLEEPLGETVRTNDRPFGI